MRRSAATRFAQVSGVAMAGARTVIGLVAVCQPGRLAQGWLGPASGSGELPSVRILGRASGGRDLVLGVGALVALLGYDESRWWIAAGGVVDALDGAATAVAWSDLPPGSRGHFLAAAAGTAVASGVICAGLPPRAR